MKIAVVDYCKGNLRSVQKGLELAGAAASISDDPSQIASADAIVLPGVGSFHDACTFMTSSGQMEVIRARVAAGVPFLGICLGLQLLFERGDEGVVDGWDEGLGILPGTVRRMNARRPDQTLVKVPHVGWNDVRYCMSSPLFDQIPDGSYFYFTHSYIVMPEHPADIIAEVEHAERFCAAVQRDNVFGVQFHPEKSSKLGMKVLENFVRTVRGS
jgi:imidazole glycerol-phosphate synthase subunit HisH